jgi:hypothetical protein
MQEMKILEREAEIKRPPPQTPQPILINSSTINIDTKASLSLSLSHQLDWPCFAFFRFVNPRFRRRLIGNLCFYRHRSKLGRKNLKSISFVRKPSIETSQFYGMTRMLSSARNQFHMDYKLSLSLKKKYFQLSPLTFDWW